MTPRARIFIVDDHPLVREWLANLLRQQADFDVCGQAEDAVEADHRLDVAANVDHPLEKGRAAGQEIDGDAREDFADAFGGKGENFAPQLEHHQLDHGLVHRNHLRRGFAAGAQNTVEGDLGFTHDGLMSRGRPRGSGPDAWPGRARGRLRIGSRSASAPATTSRCRR